jgi:hypothetical protein
MKARYSVEVIDQGQGGIIADHILARENDLDAAHALYRFCTRQFPNRVFLLTDRARVLVRSDVP